MTKNDEEYGDIGDYHDHQEVEKQPPIEVYENSPYGPLTKENPKKDSKDVPG